MNLPHGQKLICVFLPIVPSHYAAVAKSALNPTVLFENEVQDTN